jgi:hypothetical protein
MNKLLYKTIDLLALNQIGVGKMKLPGKTKFDAYIPSLIGIDPFPSIATSYNRKYTMY